MVSAPSRRRLGATSRVGRYTQRAWLRVSALEGVVLGVLILNEYVAKKTLGASDAVLTTLVVAPTAALLFSAWWSGFLGRREKSSTFLVYGVLGRLSLVLVAGTASAGAFTAVIAVATFLFGAIIPAHNALLQRNFTVAERGRVVGVAVAVQSLATIAASVAAGRIYDAWPSGYRAMYVVAGACGFAACRMLSRVRFRHVAGRERELPLFGATLVRDLAPALRRPFAGTVRLLREDAGFRRYETAYMAYGMAWMMLLPTVPVFLVERLDAAYAQVSMARGLIYFSVLAAASPLFGRLLDRVGPLRVSRLSFAVLALYPLLLVSAGSLGPVYAAFALFGVGMAGVQLGWTIGPIYFARERDSAGYMGAHVALVGLRSVVGAPLGMVLYRATGSPEATFAAAALLFLLATLLMGSALEK